MVVLSARICKDKYKQLHWDFIEETCRSFNAKVLSKDDIELPIPNIGVIALNHATGDYMQDLDLSEVHTVLVGCDDDRDDDWMAPYRQVRISSPVNYYLWSGVALGIFLHHLHISSLDKGIGYEDS